MNEMNTETRDRPVTPEYLVKLNMKLKQAISRQEQSRVGWDHLLDQARSLMIRVTRSTRG